MNETNNNQKPRASKLVIAVLITALIIFIICINWPSSPYHGRRLPTHIKCAIKLYDLGAAISGYAMDNDGCFPTAEDWCDLLLNEAYVHLEKRCFICEVSDAVTGQSSYALNKNIAGLKLDEVTQEIVLLFETTPGWNQSGTSEIMAREAHEIKDGVKGCNVLFADFADYSVRFVETKDLGTLRWEP
jgi:hypothetical protein